MERVTILQQRPNTTDPVTLTGAAGVLSLMLTFDDADSLEDVVDALALRDFVEGRQPWAVTKRLDRVRDGATLLPPGVTPTRTAVGDGRDTFLARGDGWTVHAIRWQSGGGVVNVTAESEALARSVLSLATDGAAEPPAPDDERVEIGFWHLTGHGPRRRSRPITASPWAEIRPNYAPAAATAIEQLMGIGADDLTGRMLLVHGPPGTGKTTALRSLAREWRSWCQLDFVIDPERLFAEPGYLIEVVLGASDEDGPPWRLLLLEDCDELIRSDAKQSTGQSLSRLLNLTDGILGQGRQILVAITTNENVARLHPAVTRPGRCLAQIEVGRLPYPEAVAWLGTSKGVDAAGATLAELYALRDGKAPVSTPEPAPVGGFYL
jgi:hypothetical protein